MADSSARVFRASAPVRLDLAGGWTDVAPFAVVEHGAVVNAAIDLRTEAHVQPGGGTFHLTSEDLGETLELQGQNGLDSNGRLGLLRAALRLSGLTGGSLTTRSQVPPGSGLGSSGALDVALIAALDAAQGRQRAPVDLAEAAWRLETIEAGLPGGKQDQYAAALGGFHHLRFEAGSVAVTPLRLEPDFLAELEQRILVCYTGTSRVSSSTIERVMAAYSEGREQVVSALRALAQRTGVSEVGSLVAMLVQTERFGTSLADALRVHAEGMRVQRMQRAEEQAAKAPLKMLFPTLIIFIATLVVTLGPGLLQLFSFFTEKGA